MGATPPYNATIILLTAQSYLCGTLADCKDDQPTLQPAIMAAPYCSVKHLSVQSLEVCRLAMMICKPATNKYLLVMEWIREGLGGTQ